MNPDSSTSPFQVMIKPAGPLCNLNCTYCYYLEKKEFFEESEFVMHRNVLERFTQQYIHALDDQITFGWQGGEPTLLGIDFFREALTLQRKHNTQGKNVQNTIQTNGTLLNNEWGEFLRENNFLVGISIDGPPELHNHFRVSQKGNPTFSSVKRGLEVLKKHSIAFNALVTVNSMNVKRPLEVYRFLRDKLGIEFIQIIPIVIQKNVRKGSISGDDYGKFLTSIFDEWVRNDVGEVFVQLFDAALGAWLGLQPALCVFAPTCGHALVLEHNGNLYSCDHFVNPENKVGNIMVDGLIEVVGGVQQTEFGRNKLDSLPNDCIGCDVRFACNGGCPKIRFTMSKAGENNMNHLCSGYQTFFRHIDPYMRFMADELRNGRPATNVMRKFEH